MTWMRPNVEHPTKAIQYMKSSPSARPISIFMRYLFGSHAPAWEQVLTLPHHGIANVQIRYAS